MNVDYDGQKLLIKDLEMLERACQSDTQLLQDDNIPTLLDWDRIQKQIDEATSKTPEKNIDVKGSILPYLRLPLTIHPWKRGCFVHKCLDRCRSVSRTTLEKFGACFGMIGAVFVALPATVAYTFATNAMFLVGDIFLLTLFLRDGRNWLIVQYSVFGVLAFWGVCNNLPGVLL